MQCQTQKPGIECLFMKKAGCSYVGGKCFTVIESCEGCTRVVEYATGKFCMSFPNPGQKWQGSASCTMATHVKKAQKAEEQKVNPLKASKRAAGKK
jgi:hypothetical protein